MTRLREVIIDPPLAKHPEHGRAAIDWRRPSIAATSSSRTRCSPRHVSDSKYRYHARRGEAQRIVNIGNAAIYARIRRGA
jgi:hypothetical protein